MTARLKAGVYPRYISLPFFTAAALCLAFADFWLPNLDPAMKLGDITVGQYSTILRSVLVFGVALFLLSRSYKLGERIWSIDRWSALFALSLVLRTAVGVLMFFSYHTANLNTLSEKLIFLGMSWFLLSSELLNCENWRFWR